MLYLFAQSGITCRRTLINLFSFCLFASHLFHWTSKLASKHLSLEPMSISISIAPKMEISITITDAFFARNKVKTVHCIDASVSVCVCFYFWVKFSFPLNYSLDFIKLSMCAMSTCCIIQSIRFTFVTVNLSTSRLKYLIWFDRFLFCTRYICNTKLNSSSDFILVCV